MTKGRKTRAQRVAEVVELARQYQTLRNDGTRGSLQQWVELRLSCSSKDAGQRITEAGGVSQLLRADEEQQ